MDIPYKKCSKRIIFLIAILLSTVWLCMAPPNAYPLTVEQERELGREFLAKIRKQLVLVKDDFVNEYVNDLGKYLIKPLETTYFPFDFYVVNKSFVDSTGANPLMDLIVYDVNKNGSFDRENDFVLVGDVVTDALTGLKRWGGTIFAIDFTSITNNSEMPKANDVYRIDFIRPFHPKVDSLIFTINGSNDLVDNEQLSSDMDKIRVVPNPYVVTNTMEEAVANWDRNQRRQIMFTHIPAQCKISIFTLSGILVDEFEVDNSVENRSSKWDLNSGANGTAHWDLRSKEGLEIAAGYYIYHVEAKATGDTKIGKFAVIK